MKDVTNKQIKQQGQQSSLILTIQYYTFPSLYLASFLTIKYLNNPWLSFWFIFALIPMIDEWIETDTRNPNKQQIILLDAELNFKFPLYLCCFADLAYLLWVLDYLTHADIGILNIASTILTSGILASLNFTVAHELFHKDNIIDKTMGTATMARNLYMHFAIEHIFGHHRHVATPFDPTSAARGETLLHFIGKSVKGSYLSAWKFECQRVKKVYSTKSLYNINNRMIWYTASYFVLPLIVCLIYGPLGALYFVIIAIISIILLETINYIEHYGLSRKEISKGIYEPVSILHSWNAPHRLSNSLLFKLQRHSDHHENPSKPYQTLCTYEQSPTLPHGYSVCILLAIYQKLWFEVMDQQLLVWQKNDPVLMQQNTDKVVKFVRQVAFLSTVIIIKTLL